MSSDASAPSAASPEAPRRWVNAAVIGQEAARQTWALAAREKLEETARTYGAVVTYKELADWVQERSLIRTKQLHMHWIGDVLARVSAACHERGEPLLSALCVDARGHVGPGYAVAVEMQRGTPLADPDDHASHERLACHRWHGADLPEDGGLPVVTVRPPAPRAPARTTSRSPGGQGASPRAATPTRTAGSRTTSRPASAPEKPLAVCPVHSTVLPATGICDDCE
jgi:hypothetical protein